MPWSTTALRAWIGIFGDHHTTMTATTTNAKAGGGRSMNKPLVRQI
jgi:hypothetical protein